MGNALGIFSRQKRVMKTLLLGLDAAGKTTILWKLKLGEIVTTIPTIGFNLERVEHKGISINAWDVGGRDKIRPLLRHYYKGTDALVFVIDSSDKDRIDDAVEELERTLKEDELKDCKVVILANKQDLPGALTAKEVTEKLGNITKNRSQRQIPVFPTCAITGEGLIEPFQWLHSQVSGDMTKDSSHGKSKGMNFGGVGKGFWDNVMMKMKYIFVD